MLTRFRGSSGSFAFPAPRSSLPVAWRDLRGFPSRRRLRRSTSRPIAGSRPSSLRSPNEPDDIAVVGLERPRSVRADHLSWDSYGRDRPGALPSTPACAGPFGHPSVSTSRSIAAASVRRLRPPDVFRPRGFAPPRRFSPPMDSRACCIPLPIVGFDVFRPLSPGVCRSRSRPRCQAHESSVTLDVGLPTPLFVPPGGFPPPAARPVSPRSLPSRTSAASKTSTTATRPLPDAPFV
jgi:hypothetical protein